MSTSRSATPTTQLHMDSSKTDALTQAALNQGVPTFFVTPNLTQKTSTPSDGRQDPEKHNATPSASISRQSSISLNRTSTMNNVLIKDVELNFLSPFNLDELKNYENGHYSFFQVNSELTEANSEKDLTAQDTNIDGNTESSSKPRKFHILYLRKVTNRKYAVYPKKREHIFYSWGEIIVENGDYIWTLHNDRLASDKRNDHDFYKQVGLSTEKFYLLEDWQFVLGKPSSSHAENENNKYHQYLTDEGNFADKANLALIQNSLNKLAPADLPAPVEVISQVNDESKKTPSPTAKEQSTTEKITSGTDPRFFTAKVSPEIVIEEPAKSKRFWRYLNCFS